ncbi:hypothetical protein BGX34_005678 [Mortierella sp. NVP85]|nr:hypothetical protein BGX34_005678 [Mortierella sp. NVP85]
MGFFGDIADAFSKNGSVTKFCEQLPVVGHVTAAIQAISGNTEAKRALATSTGNLVSTVGAVAGFCAGGPVGAVAGGSLGGLVGTFVETGIAGAINDPSVKGDLGDVTAGKIFTNVGLGGASGLLGGGGGLLKSGGTALTKEVMKDAAKVGAGNLLGQGLKGLTPKVGPTTGDPDDPKPETRTYVSQINKEKSDACATFMYAMAVKYPVTPVSGPCVNAAGTLQHMITVGQFLELGTAQFTAAFVFFDQRFYADGAYFQGGIDRAVIDLMSQARAHPGTIVENGANVQYTADQIRAMLVADDLELLRLRGIAAHSFEYEFDEH